MAGSVRDPNLPGFASQGSFAASLTETQISPHKLWTSAKPRHTPLTSSERLAAAAKALPILRSKRANPTSQPLHTTHQARKPAPSQALGPWIPPRLLHAN